MNEYLEARILIAYLIEGKSHRHIQREILNKPAPVRGGGFEAMKVLHSYDIREDSKGLLKENLNRLSELDIKAQEIIKNYFQVNEDANNIINGILINPNNKPTDRLSIMKVRVFQDVLKKYLLNNYRNCCALCEVDQVDLLNASHIIPWSIKEETRLHLNNSILLCSFHDKLFDKGYITLDDDYNVVISKELSKNVSFMLEGLSFKKPKSNIPSQEYLNFHREQIFR